MPTIVNPLLFGIIELKEQYYVTLLVEVRKCAKARVWRQHLQEYVPRVHVLGNVGHGLVLIVEDV